MLSPTLCDSMDDSMPGFTVLHCLLDFAQTHVHWVSDATQPSSSVPHFSSCPQSFPASEYFPISWLQTSGGQSIGASASASVLPMNIWGSFPVELTCLISLPSKGFSRVFSSTTIRKHQFFSICLLYGPTLTSTHDYGKTIALTIWIFVDKVMFLLLNMLSMLVK